MRERGRTVSSGINRRAGIWRVLRVMAGLSATGLLCFGLYWFARSSIFDLKYVEYSGNRYLSSKRLKDMTGVSEGVKIWGFSLEEVSRRMSVSPWIKSVSLRKEYPRRLMVNIREAVPVALLEREGGRLFLVDSEGVVLEALKGKQVPFLPVIVGGGDVNRSTFLEAVALAGTIKKMGVAVSRGRVEISGLQGGPEGLSVSIDGMLVRVGDGDYEEKLSRLFDLSGEINKRDIDVDYVDLRFDDRVVVKPVAGVAGVHN